MAIKTWFTCLILGLLLSAPVSAGVISRASFDFTMPLLTETNVEGVTLSAVSGDLTINVTPQGALIGGSSSQNNMVDTIKSDWGLGLLNRNVANDRSTLFRRIHIDGTNSPEMIRLIFSDEVKVEEIFFAFVGPFERFDMAVDGVDIDVVSELGTDLIYRLAPDKRPPGLVRLPDSLPSGKVWDFLAKNAGDEWNIEGIDVGKIPEPSALMGLASLLALGLVVRHRRRKSS